MATLCTKCLIGSLGQGGGLLPAESEIFRLELIFEPESDGEVVGERRVVFAGEVVEGSPYDGGASVVGVLSGNFGVAEDSDLELPATLDTFTRDGGLAFVNLTVRGESGRVTFSANLTPQKFDTSPDETILDAVVFMGRQDNAMAD